MSSEVRNCGKKESATNLLFASGAISDSTVLAWFHGGEGGGRGGRGGRGEGGEGRGGKCGGGQAQMPQVDNLEVAWFY